MEAADGAGSSHAPVARLKEALRRAGVRKPSPARLLEKVARASGYHLLPRHYYTPIPEVDELPASLWDRRSELPGVELDLEAHVTFLEKELAPYVGEFTPPLFAGPDPDELSVFNGWYQGLDAEVLYAMVRFVKPKRIVELGSGYTTQIIGAACARNAAEGVTAEYRAFDPFPRPRVLEGAAGITEFERLKAQDVPLSVFAELEAGDLLFVDTSHTVTTGGDVTFITLEVLPRLAGGVFVHFHDVFLPWDYPRDWVTRHGRYWNEQYLVHAFLTLNPEFETIFAGHAVAREYPERVVEVVPSFVHTVEVQRRTWEQDRVPRPSYQVCAFWMRRRGATA